MATEKSSISLEQSLAMLVSGLPRKEKALESIDFLMVTTMWDVGTKISERVLES